MLFILGLALATIIIIMDFSNDTQDTLPYIARGFITPVSYATMDDLLQDVALVRFDELRRPWTQFHATVINEVDKIYVPLSVPEDFLLNRIVVEVITDDAPIRFIYRLPSFRAFVDPPTERATLTWRRDRPTNEEFFRGGVWPMEPRSSDTVTYHWTQHGYEFEVSILAMFPEEEAYELTRALLDPQPFTSWELQGNAVAVSIRGKESVSIFDEWGNKINYNETVTNFDFLNVFSSMSRALGHHVLYGTYEDATVRVGYSWLLDEDTFSRQFVLKPGTYTFIVDGIIGEPRLVVRHFYNREVVSIVGFSRYLAGQDFTSFTVMVTQDTTGNGDSVVINQ